MIYIILQTLLIHGKCVEEIWDKTLIRGRIQDLQLHNKDKSSRFEDLDMHMEFTMYIIYNII